jgi:hypothetical protein
MIGTCLLYGHPPKLVEENVPGRTNYRANTLSVRPGPLVAAPGAGASSGCRAPAFASNSITRFAAAEPFVQLLHVAARDGLRQAIQVRQLDHARPAVSPRRALP